MNARGVLGRTPGVICGAFGLFALGLTAAHADDAACKAVADAMLTNAKTPYHSLGIISFDPSNPASSDGSPGPSAIRTETIFTGQQVFVKLPNGQWKDIHANLAELQKKVSESADGFIDCEHLPNDKVDGKDLAVYTGSNKTDALNVATKIWISPDNGAIVRSETEVGGPTAPDGKIRKQHISLRYDYADIKAPAVSN